VDGWQVAAGRLIRSRNSIDFKRYLNDFPFRSISNWWDGFGGAPDQVYVVQTNKKMIERCLLMATDPGDLVLDPTCGAGTRAYVAEQWGRRWITVDTSRVALALARARVIGARYLYYVLADSPAGQRKAAEVTGTAPSRERTRWDIRQGFVYRRHADNSRVRVAGPFTVESLSPHRVLAVDQDDELFDTLQPAEGKRVPSSTGLDTTDFAQIMLENLRIAGVQQAHKQDRIGFTAFTGWPGEYICAEGSYLEGERERCAGHLHRPGVRHCRPPRPGRRRARGRRSPGGSR
jgi:adenine-specific DNA-methyltransferase